jgi:hypothetical protein
LYRTRGLTSGPAQVPAVHELANAALKMMFSGDASQWYRAMQMPHYNTRSMPAISLHTGMHLIQARPQPSHGSARAPGPDAQAPLVLHTLAGARRSSCSAAGLRACAPRFARARPAQRPQRPTRMRARAQWAQSGRFQLYDYGSGATNRAHYGSAAPLDVAGNYRLLDFPVDIMAGPPRPASRAPCCRTARSLPRRPELASHLVSLPAISPSRIRLATCNFTVPKTLRT